MLRKGTGAGIQVMMIDNSVDDENFLTEKNNYQSERVHS